MKYLCPALLCLLLSLLLLTALSFRTVCPVCGGPVYFFLFRFCGC